MARPEDLSDNTLYFGIALLIACVLCCGFYFMHLSSKRTDDLDLECIKRGGDVRIPGTGVAHECLSRK